jgi:hypothetical protein
MIAIQETICKEIEWHIARLPKTSAKAYFFQQAIKKKKCKTKIVQGNRAMAAPTYIGIMVHYKKKKKEVMQFFYNDDIEQCVKSTRRRWVKSRPDVPNVWLIKIGTNLSRKEILDLDNTSFQLPQCVVISSRRLFGMEELLFELSSYPIPTSPNDHPKTRSCKNIRRNKNAPTTKYTNNCTSSLILKNHLRHIKMIPHPGFGYIIILDSRIPPKIQ